jgi:hypothetical protein
MPVWRGAVSRQLNHPLAGEKLRRLSDGGISHYLAASSGGPGPGHKHWRYTVGRSHLAKDANQRKPASMDDWIGAEMSGPGGCLLRRPIGGRLSRSRGPAFGASASWDSGDWGGRRTSTGLTSTPLHWTGARGRRVRVADLCVGAGRAITAKTAASPPPPRAPPGACKPGRGPTHPFLEVGREWTFLPPKHCVLKISSEQTSSQLELIVRTAGAGIGSEGTNEHAPNPG